MTHHRVLWEFISSYLLGRYLPPFQHMSSPIAQLLEVRELRIGHGKVKYKVDRAARLGYYAPSRARTFVLAGTRQEMDARK